MRELVKFTDAELEQLDDILSRSRLAQTIPDEYAADLREIFIAAVADCASHYRDAIPHERTLATGAESAALLENIAERAEDLLSSVHHERDAQEQPQDQDGQPLQPLEPLWHGRPPFLSGRYTRALSA